MRGALQARRAVVIAQRVQQVLQGYARSLVILSVARDTDQCRDSLRLIGSCVASERGGALIVVMGCAEVFGESLPTWYEPERGVVFPRRYEPEA